MLERAVEAGLGEFPLFAEYPNRVYPLRMKMWHSLESIAESRLISNMLQPSFFSFALSNHARYYMIMEQDEPEIGPVMALVSTRFVDRLIEGWHEFMRQR